MAVKVDIWTGPGGTCARLGKLYLSLYENRDVLRIASIAKYTPNVRFIILFIKFAVWRENYVWRYNIPYIPMHTNIAIDL